MIQVPSNCRQASTIVSHTNNTTLTKYTWLSRLGLGTDNPYSNRSSLELTRLNRRDTGNRSPIQKDTKDKMIRTKRGKRTTQSTANTTIQAFDNRPKIHTALYHTPNKAYPL